MPVWEKARIAALRLLLRVAPSERQRVFALTILVGVLCGLAAVAFHLTIRVVEGLLIDRALSASAPKRVPPPTSAGAALLFGVTAIF